MNDDWKKGRDYMYKFKVDSNGEVKTTLRGAELMAIPLLNKGGENSWEIVLHSGTGE